jgi:hypothetical protein
MIMELQVMETHQVVETHQLQQMIILKITGVTGVNMQEAEE